MKSLMYTHCLKCSKLNTRLVSNVLCITQVFQTTVKNTWERTTFCDTEQKVARGCQNALSFEGWTQTLKIPEQLTNQGPAVWSDRVSPSWDIAAPIHYTFSQARSKLESQLTPLMAPLQFNLGDNRGLKTNALLKAAACTISSFCCHSEGLHSVPCFFFVASISMPLPMIKCP